MSIRELGHWQVAVCGGGPAGFCAAVAAARMGARVALIERYGMCGGILTALGNNSVDCFINPHRGEDRLIIDGIAWEFVRRLHAEGHATVPDLYAPYQSNPQYGVKVNSLAAARLMDDMLLEAGVELFYCQTLADVEVSGDAGRPVVTGLLLATKQGLARLQADFVLDTTGDGDVCAFAGADYACGGQQGELQPGTMRYYLSGNLTPETVEAGNALLAELRQSGELTGEDLLYGVNFSLIASANGDNRNHIHPLNAVDPASRTRAEIDARQRLCKLQRAIEQIGVTIAATAPEVAPRESRRIRGDSVLTGEEYLACVQQPDAVCHAFWHVDIHAPGNYQANHKYILRPETPCIPLSALRCAGLSNVFMAGRCMSGDRQAASAVRVKASCMAMGQAVGTAAALGALHGLTDSRSIPADDVRQALSAAGAIVPGLDAPRRVYFGI